MTIKTALDCWACVVLKRAGGDADVPTLDAATGAEEQEREWLLAAQVRMQGWHESEKRRELYLDESINLAIADVLQKLIETGAPRTSKGQDVRTCTTTPAIGKKGPAEVECAYLGVETLMAVYCATEGQDLHGLKFAAMKLHPRKGVFEGLGSKDSWAMNRFLGRHRATLKPFLTWYGTLVPQQSEQKSEDFQVKIEAGEKSS